MALTASFSYESLSKCLYNWSYISVNVLPFKSTCLRNVLIPSADMWRRESVREKRLMWEEKRRGIQGRDRERHKEKKTPAQLVWTEDLSHDLNILGDKMCPHCRDSFPRKTCSFSSVRGTHQWSIVSVRCDHIALPHGRYKAAVITQRNYGKKVVKQYLCVAETA